MILGPTNIKVKKEFVPDTFIKECTVRTFSTSIEPNWTELNWFESKNLKIYEKKTNMKKQHKFVSFSQNDFNIKFFIHRIKDFILKMINIFHSFRPNCRFVCIPFGIYSPVRLTLFFAHASQPIGLNEAHWAYFQSFFSFFIFFFVNSFTQQRKIYTLI